MSHTHALAIAVASFLFLAPPAVGQVPADLRAAMQARDSAVFNADAGVWDRLTAATFTVVQEDGSMMTKAQRLAQLRTESPRPFQPRSREVVNRYADVFVARFLSGPVWVLEVWARENGSWKVVAVQVTSAKK